MASVCPPDFGVYDEFGYGGFYLLEAFWVVEVDGGGWLSWDVVCDDYGLDYVEVVECGGVAIIVVYYYECVMFWNSGGGWWVVVSLLEVVDQMLMNGLDNHYTVVRCGFMRSSISWRIVGVMGYYQILVDTVEGWIGRWSL